ncbi:MAG: OmpA family protein [Deltaproteobacteria bacterium]|nr:OmpA family protein [Deltaproteobacteria bacterium]
MERSARFRFAAWVRSPLAPTMLLAASVALATTLLSAAPARASQPAPSLDANMLAPLPAGGDGLSVPVASARGFGLFVGVAYARKPLSFRGTADGVSRSQVIFGDLSLVDLGAAVPVGPVLIEASLPIATVIRGGGPNLLDVEPALAPAFGDLRIGARYGLWQREDSPIGAVHVAVRGGWRVPTAQRNAWLGGSAARFDLSLLGSWAMGPWSAALQLGATLRPLDAATVQVVRPETGEVVVGTDGVPLRDTVLASGSRFEARLRLARVLPWQDLVVAAEGQFLADLDPGATAGQALADGMIVAELPLQRGAFRLFAAVGGAATRSWGSAQVRALAGLRFRPDRLPSDRDGDGLDDRDDRCPEQAEDRDGYEDDDGCPDLDDDGDGIPDTQDRCRLEPEDKDGFEDGDGCPDLDDDDDGIPDAQDRCPRPAADGGSTVEDVDGFEDGDGCPDPDNDGDGISDLDDLCPDAAETVNGFEDGDGCPDTPPPPLASIEGGRILLARPIRFLPGTATLDADARILLGAVVRLLREIKAITALEVAVFTDDGGEIADRLAMTQARADAVKASLVGVSGLADHAIRAVGMADSMPVASNADAAGRSRNRRVELRILNGPDAVAPLEPPKPPKSRRRRRR